MRNFLILVLFLAGLPALYSQTCTNRCLDFDGTGDYVQSAVSPVTGNANFTIEARFQCTSTGSSFRRLLAFGGTNTRFEVGEVNGRIVYYRQSSAGAFGPSQIAATVIRGNGWHHLAVRRDTASPTQELKFYLDCNLIFTTALGGTLNIGSFRVGNPTVAVTGTPWWTGQIDEVRVWNFARTDANISATCNCGLSGTESGLKLYYDFDQAGITPGGNNPGQTTVLDQTANANNGTLNTFALSGATSNWVCGSANFADCAGCVAEFSYTADSCRHVQFTNLTPNNPAIPPYSYSWNFGDATATSTATSPSHTYAASGIYNVCLTISTAAGAVVCTTCHQVTVIADPIPPMAKCAPPFSVQVSAGGFAQVLAGSINNGSTDNCGVASATISIDGFTCQDACPPNNQHAVVLTVTDLSGNTSTCTTVVTVVDVIKPVAKCKNVQVSVGANGTFTLPAANVDSSSTDNCGITSMSVNPNIISCPKICPEFKTVTLTVTDCSGNSATCSAQVEVRDAIAPTVTCPQNITLHTSPGICQAIFPQALATMTDNCGATGTYTLTGATENSGTGTGGNSQFNPGVTTVHFVAKDVCNNSSACSYTVVVVDQEPPQIVCPANMTIPCTPGVPAPLMLPGPTFLADNCTNPLSFVTSPNLASIPCGTQQVITYLAADDSGNTASCSFTVSASSITPNCTCTGFSNLNFGTVGGKTLLVACGQPFTVPCPVAGTSFVLTGSLACSGSACAPSNLHWELTNSSNTVIGSGPLSGATFSLPVNGTLIQAPGTYTLSLFGDCGQQTCRCDVKMVVQQCPGVDFPGFGCGEAIFDCFSGFTNGSINDPVNASTIKNDAVLAVADIRNHALAIPYTNPSNSWPDVHPLYHHPDWNSGNMGQVFGLAIDRQNNVYAAATTLHGQMPPGSLPGAGPGTIYKINGVTGQVSVWANLPNALTARNNIKIGLGDLTYDRDHDQIFASNFFDGKIYRLNMAGVILQTYDPPLNDPAVVGQGFHDPSAPADFAPRGQRIWGVGYNKNVLYFGVWTVDRANYSTSRYNELWSVPLDPSTGAFTGATNSAGSWYQFDQLERSLPTINLSPISDIAFSCEGDLIFATKTMNGNFNDWSYSPSFAHYASTWKLPLNNLASGPLKQYFIGGGGNRTNGSGGVDVGYGSFNPAVNPLPSVLDDKIWVTADLMKAIDANNHDWIYGLSGLPYAGNTYSDVVNTSIFIDVDNLPAKGAKTYYGDVEIFKCLACPGTIPPLCDSITASVRPTKERDGCCHYLNIENHFPNYFTYVNLCVIDGGTLSGAPVASAGWTLQGYSGNNALFQPAGGATIPTGSFQVGKFCLDNLTADMQHIEIKYFDANFEVICRDTISISCDACVQAVVDSVYCKGFNQYGFSISVKAGPDLGYLANSVTIVPVGAVDFNVPLPNKTNADGSVVVSLPSLPPGGTIHNIPINISGSLPAGQVVCFYAIIHDNDLTKNESDIDCCADTVPVCFPLPECDPCNETYAEIRPVDSPTPSDSCCWKITLHNPDNYFTQVAVNVLTPGYQFSAIGSTIGSGWSMLSSSPTSASFDPVPPQGTGAYVVDGWQLPSMCFKPSGGSVVSPQKIEVVWKVDSIICRDTLDLSCKFSKPCLQVDSIAVRCTPGAFPTKYTLLLGIRNTTSTVKGYLEVVSVTPGTVTVTPPGVYQTFNPGVTTYVTLNVNGPNNALACFRFGLHQINDDSLHLNCCVMEDSVCIKLPACLPSEPQTMTVNLYPNPASDVLNLAFSDALPAPATLRILDMAGRPMSAVQLLAAGTEITTLDLNHLSDGMYLADIQVTGLVAIRKRFIVHRSSVEWQEK